MIIEIKNLANIRNQHKNEKIVLTSGTFDLLHVGHIDYLSAVKAHGDIMVVLLSGDDRVKARKGSKRPIIRQDDRAKMLDELKVVDYVLIDSAVCPPNQTDPVYAEILAELQPNLYVTDGPDPRFWDILDKTKFVILPDPRAGTDGDISTSKIIERIASL